MPQDSNDRDLAGSDPDPNITPDDSKSGPSAPVEPSASSGESKGSEAASKTPDQSETGSAAASPAAKVAEAALVVDTANSQDLAANLAELQETKVENINQAGSEIITGVPTGSSLKPEDKEPPSEPSENSTRSGRSKKGKTPTQSPGRYEYCSYSIVVRTAKQKNAGTNANVFVQLTDEDGVQTDKLRLKCSITHRQKFRRGHSDLFLLVDQNQLGSLKHVDVWHQKKKAAGTWVLHSINVIEHQTHRLYRFPYLKTIGDDEDSGKINHVRLDVVGEPVKVLNHDHFQVVG